MKLAAIVLPLVMVLAAPAWAQPKSDIAGASDHPQVGRYQGSVITFRETKAYEETALPNAALGRGMEKDDSSWQVALSGRVTSLRYEGPGGRSVLEILRNFEVALKSDGFEIAFFCRGPKQCAPGGRITNFWNAARGGIGLPSAWDTSIYLLARRDTVDGIVTVGILGVETRAYQDRPLMPHIALTVVEGKPMETDKIAVIEASAMEKSLTRDGRVALYGIYFDFDKADIRAESKEQIDQIAALLKSNPKLDVIVAGHTDGKGTFDYNLSLSQRRAQAVANALVNSYGIARDRMTASGVGMSAPVASNRTEQGRARNRRVEIVERIQE